MILLERWPPNEIPYIFDAFILHICKDGTTHFSFRKHFSGEAPIARSMLCDHEATFLIASAQDQETLVDKAWLQSDLNNGSYLFKLISKILQNYSSFCDCFVWKNDEAENQIIKSMLFELSGYSRDDLEIWETESWLLSKYSNYEQIIHRLSIDKNSSDTGVGNASKIVNAEALNNNIYLRDCVESAVREILFKYSS